MRTVVESSPASSPIPAFEQHVRRAWIATLCLLALVVGLPARVQAEQQQTRNDTQADTQKEPSPEVLARARRAFQHGVQAADRQDYAGAARHFREALALHHAPAAAYNLASALYEQHEHVEAYNLVQEMLGDPELPAALRKRAQKLEQTLELEVARLTVVTSGANHDITAEVDGEPLPPQLLGQPRAVTPGTHEVAALRDGQVISRRSVDIARRTNALVDVSLIVTESGEAATEPASSLARVGDGKGAPHSGWRNRKLWIGVAVGVAVVGASALTVVLLRDRETSGSAEPIMGDSGVLTW